MMFYKELTQSLSENGIKSSSKHPKNKKSILLENEARAIKSSLGKEGNPFRKLISEFQRIFLIYYRKKLRELNLVFYEDNSYRVSSETNNRGLVNSNLAEKIRKDAMLDIGHFCKLLLRCISLFYRSLMGEEKLVHLKDHISTYLLCYIIRKDTYHLLAFLYRVENSVEENILSNKIDRMKDVTPQELGINKYLCLNEVSSLYEVHQAALLHNESGRVELRGDAQESILAPADSLKDRVKGNPYDLALKWLRKIVWVDSPWKKLKLISKFNEIICDCIDQFWKGTHINPDKLRIDADQYITIMIYIVYKANVKNLYSHLRFAVDFTLFEIKPSYNNYCLTTFQACFSHLIEVGQSVVTVSTKDGLQESGRGNSPKIGNKENKDSSKWIALR